MAPTDPRLHPPHAVVIGAGLRGLAAARALGHHLERVTLIERGDVPDRVAPAAPGDRYARALRQVLDAPQVVVRAGLEAVGVTIASGRVHGVEVCSRPTGTTRRMMAIGADLVVDATGRGPTSTVAPPDGLVVVGTGGRHLEPSSPAMAELAATVLGRCLGEHLRHHAGLTGFSADAQRAMAQVGAVTPTAAR